MTNTSKQIVEWIKSLLKEYQKKVNNDNFVTTNWKLQELEDIFKAVSFLDSLPDIEARLCRGGYIQDSYGTPCCDGDMVRFVTNSDYEGYGYLKWSRDEKRFLIEEIVDKDTIGYDYVIFGLKQFRRVEPGLKGKD